MIFTTKAEYGVRLLVELGLRGGHPGPLFRSRRSRRRRTSRSRIFERIVALFVKRDGLVESVRGAHGGYRLTW